MLHGHGSIRRMQYNVCSPSHSDASGRIVPGGGNSGCTAWFALLATVLLAATICWTCYPLSLVSCLLSALQPLPAPPRPSRKMSRSRLPSRAKRIRYLQGRLQGNVTAAQIHAVSRSPPSFDRPFIFRCGRTCANKSDGLACAFPENFAPGYLRDMRVMCASMNTSAAPLSIAVQFGDATPECTALPIFVKARRVADRCGILLPLNTARHWRDVRMTKLTYVPWEHKLDTRLVWRGSHTGVVRRSFVHALAAAGHDVAFNIKVKSVGRTALQRHMWEEDMSAPLIRRQLMGYKYILCLEGNDVATSLKWQMAHNSLIFMPTPTKESWLMEGLLRPWVHYVPLDSPHEAADRLRWARANDAECQRIVANANAWVESLQNDVEWWQLPAMLMQRHNIERLGNEVRALQ